MKKAIYKSLIICVAICTIALSAIAYASFEKITSDSLVEARQISQIENDLNIDEIKSAFAGDLYIDENGEEQMTEGIDVDCSVNDLVKKYHIATNDMATGSIYNNLSDTYKYYLPIKHNGDVVGMANIKIGEPVEEMRKKIESLNMSEEGKNDILDIVKAREGKWFIASISRYVDGEGYLMPEELQNKLTESGITDIIDVKYTSIEDYASEAFVVKTKTNEYIIPINLRSNINSAQNGEIYSTDQTTNAIAIAKAAEMY